MTLAILLILVVAEAGYIGVNPGITKTVTKTVTSGVSTSSQSSSSSSLQFAFTGAGSTFIFPLMSAWTTQYHTTYPNIQVSYSGIGSGGGISALEGHTLDFAASDAPLSGTDISKAANALTIPATIGAVTVAYNIPGVKTGIQLSGSVIADIYLGKVTMWNDPEIVNLQTNSTLAAELPAQEILVVHRSDSSGTTFTFTGFLTEDSSDWNSTVGQGKSVQWPIGVGANGNSGVAGVVQGTSYTIGYVELAYALQNKMTVAAVENPANTFVLPTLDSSAAAAQNVAGLPAGSGDWSKVNLLNQPGANTYPIVTFSYILVYKELNVSPSQTSGSPLQGATALVHFLWWVVNDGQAQSTPLSYVPLPQNVVTLDEQTISSITFNGQALQSH